MMDPCALVICQRYFHVQYELDVLLLAMTVNQQTLCSLLIILLIEQYCSVLQLSFSRFLVYPIQLSSHHHSILQQVRHGSLPYRQSLNFFFLRFDLLSQYKTIKQLKTRLLGVETMGYPIVYPSFFTPHFHLDCCAGLSCASPNHRRRSIASNSSSVSSRLISPSVAILIAPVSSETIIVIASDTSLKPIAARCLVPNSLEMNGFSDNGK